MLVPTSDYTSARCGGPAAEGVECSSVRVGFAVASFVSVVLMARGSAQQGTRFQTGVDLENVGVTVTDKGRKLVTGLTADDFDVTEDGKKQTVSYFAAGDRVGPPAQEMHLGLLLDVSESMGEDIGFTKTAAIK